MNPLPKKAYILHYSLPPFLGISPVYTAGTQSSTTANVMFRLSESYGLAFGSAYVGSTGTNVKMTTLPTVIPALATYGTSRPTSDASHSHSSSISTIETESKISKPINIPPLLIKHPPPSLHSPSDPNNANPRIRALPRQKAQSPPHLRRRRLRRHTAPQGSSRCDHKGAMGQEHDGATGAG